MTLKIITALASLLNVVLYLAIVHRIPTFRLFTPRGGIVPLIISLLIANGMVWASQQADRPASTRFQLLVAAWIWITVQIGCSLYIFNSDL